MNLSLLMLTAALAFAPAGDGKLPPRAVSRLGTLNYSHDDVCVRSIMQATANASSPPRRSPYTYGTPPGEKQHASISAWILRACPAG